MEYIYFICPCSVQKSNYTLFWYMLVTSVSALLRFETNILTARATPPTYASLMRTVYMYIIYASVSMICSCLGIRYRSKVTIL